MPRTPLDLCKYCVLQHKRLIAIEMQNRAIRINKLRNGEHLNDHSK